MIVHDNEENFEIMIRCIDKWLVKANVASISICISFVCTNQVIEILIQISTPPEQGVAIIGETSIGEPLLIATLIDDHDRLLTYENSWLPIIKISWGKYPLKDGDKQSNKESF